MIFNRLLKFGLLYGAYHELLYWTLVNRFTFFNGFYDFDVFELIRFYG